MSNEQPDFFKYFNLLWPVVGGWAVWMQKKLDGKADKDELEARHNDNIDRLERIIGTMDKIDEKVDQLAETVAVLCDRTGFPNGRRR